nr:hypothetical protein [Bradyrhizobium elkanii]
MPRDHRLGVDRRLGDAHADEDADHDQEEARQEGQPPAPAHQILARQHGHQREGAGGEQIADGDAEWREAAPEAAMFRRRVLDQVDHRTAIFGAGAEALDHAHRDQEDRRPDPDLPISRQEADRGGADADHQECGDQHRLAAIAIAEDAE